ncbi:MAG: penicillin-binding protein 2, partial [Actinomycetota bacterium]
MPRERRMSRMAVLGTVAMTLGSLLTVRLWFLQAVDSGALQERVREVRTRTVKITPERGRIFDLKGRIVADNERILTVTIDRPVIAKSIDRQQMWDRLSGVLN